MPTDCSPAEHAARVAEILRAGDRFLVAAHASPDGDAIGASAGLVWLLRGMGKKAVLYNASGVPDYLEWMSLPGRVYQHLGGLPFRPEMLLALDCGDAWRLGNELSEALPRYPSVNIDHHLGNPCFGSLYNWVDPGMAAAGQMTALVADAAGISLEGELAACVYVSIVSDTGSFTHGNTSADVLLLASRLLRGGLDAGALRASLDNQWTLPKTHFWGDMLRKVRLERGGQVGVCEISLADLAARSAVRSDAEGLVEQIRRIRGVRVALLAREEAPGRTKISLRSCGDDDVRSVAAQLGGGGHKNAAGATVDMPVPEAVETVLELVKL